MKLYAFDVREDDEWKKNWPTLAVDIRVIDGNCREDVDVAIAEIGRLDCRVLLTVHARNGIETLRSAMIKALDANNAHCIQGFMLYVSGGANIQLPAGSPSWKYAATRKMASAADLSSHRDAFARLASNLLDANDERTIQAAWKEFDRSALAELIEIVSPLALLPPMDASTVSEVVVGRLRAQSDGWWESAKAGLDAEEDKTALTQLETAVATNPEINSNIIVRSVDIARLARRRL